MAEAVSIPLKTLGNFLVENVKFLSSVSSDVKELQIELERIKAFLKDADAAKQHTRERERNWVREVRDLCYLVEDTLEIFAVKIAMKRSGEGIKKVFEKSFRFVSEGKARYEVGRDIKTINARTIKLQNSFQTYGIEKLPQRESSNENQWWLNQTFSHGTEDFTGRQEKLDKLVSLIVGTDLPIISIYGMGGQGKTTLAQQIYNHAEVKDRFDSFAWYCISQKCDPEKVLQDILKQLVREGKEDVIAKTKAEKKTEVMAMTKAERKPEVIMQMTKPELVRELNELQKKKKCLVVLDDIWETSHWEMLCAAFPIADQASRSKILLTTRKEKVAKFGYPFILNSMPDKEGRQLLQKIVFPRRKEPKLPHELEDVGTKIVIRCGNLPLSISVVGGVLKGKETVREWEKVLDNIDLHLGMGEGEVNASRSLGRVLGLSFDDLPFYLKPCFLYMGIFREDEDIELRRLYHLWIAEGMVLSEHRIREEETMMDVAERYLVELASRCMVKVKMDNDSTDVEKIKSCKPHYQMKEYCLKKGKEEQFLEHLDMDVHGGTSSLSDTPHRLALWFTNGKSDVLSLKKETLQHLRTLFVRNGVFRESLNFQLCRVLILEGCEFHTRRRKQKLPKEISKMIHLRYLSVKGCELRKMPKYLGDLPYLETLDLRTSGTTVLPNIFWKMKRLRHLYLPKDIVASGLKFGLIELETLDGFKSDMCKDWHHELSTMVNLRYFRGMFWDKCPSNQLIDCWKKATWLKISIGRKNKPVNIEELLRCSNLKDLEVYDIPMENFMQYESQCWPKLTRLELFQTDMGEESMEFLKKLPRLQELILHFNSFLGKEIICGSADFRKLKSLLLFGLPNLEILRVDKGALRYLSTFKIIHCKKLKIVPRDGLRHLRNLKDLVIGYGMPENFKQEYGMLQS